MKKEAQMPDLGTMPAAGGEAPAAPASTFKVIYSPLDSLGKILADLDFKAFLENNFGTDEIDLAQKVWTMYGGAEDQMGKGKPGKRSSSPASDNPDEQAKIQEEEYNNTRDSRWERLPEGVSIEEITTPEAIEKSIIGGYNVLFKEVAKPASAKFDSWLKTANIADENGHYKYADKIEKLISSLR